ncbi:hypothetical protein [Hymenobacter edaphi]|uniref:hypothetical protein n=1 Tax=Hymenobacter edaphi TaxID=2211146 RepID=UPI0010583067|nr:hypothetical protein [Hymenobacter edaphi]
MAGIPGNRGEGARRVEGFVPGLPGGGGVRNLQTNNNTAMQDQDTQKTTAMASPNEAISIYKGLFQLANLTGTATLNGQIYFKWLPDAMVRFEGIHQHHEHDNPDHIAFFNHDEKTDIIINGLLFGKGFINQVNISKDTTIKGIIPGQAVIGEGNIPVDSVHFSIANFRRLATTELIFTYEDWSISIKESKNFKDKEDNLNDQGGYFILHNGTITNKRNPVKLSEIQDLVHSFSTYLTFINGRRCSLLFLNGVFNNEIIWQDFTPRFTDQYKPVFSWAQKFNNEGLVKAWQNFNKLWKNKSDQNFLSGAIHWYIEANGHAAFTEGSIVLTQTALELIYNWLLIEQKRILIGRDAENISASNKIRLLLNQINLPVKIPQNLKAILNNIKLFETIKNEEPDGPDVFVQIRNIIVHSQEEKRRKLMDIPSMSQYEALQIGLWYTELCLLYILNFNESYRNRCLKARWAGSDEEIVPWAKS